MQKGLKTGPISRLRFGAAFLGFLALGMVGFAAMGFPMVWENYTAIVLVTGVLGMVLGSIAWSKRAPVLRGVAGGVAREVSGVPTAQGGTAAEVVVALGGLSFRMKKAQAAQFMPDRMNRITYIDGGAIRGPKQRAGLSVAVVIERNGTPLPSPDYCHVIDGDTGDPAALTPTSIASMGRGT